MHLKTMQLINHKINKQFPMAQEQNGPKPINVLKKVQFQHEQGTKLSIYLHHLLTEITKLNKMKSTKERTIQALGKLKVHSSIY